MIPEKANIKRNIFLCVARKDYWCALLEAPFKIEGTPTLINRRASNGIA